MIKNDFFNCGLVLSLIFIILNSCQKGEDSFPIDDILSPEKEYFLSIALEKELISGVSLIKKWQGDINIFINDTTQTELINEFESIKEEINNLSSSIKLKRVFKQDAANFLIFFDKESYLKHEPNAISFLGNNTGLVLVYWDSSCNIYKGNMFTDISEANTLSCKKHALREELTQGLGLLNDKFSYKESIFYQGFSCTTNYTYIDKKVIGFFLNPLIKSGMNRDEAIEVLRNL